MGEVDSGLIISRLKRCSSLRGFWSGELVLRGDLSLEQNVLVERERLTIERILGDI